MYGQFYLFSFYYHRFFECTRYTWGNVHKGWPRKIRKFNSLFHYLKGFLRAPKITGISPQNKDTLNGRLPHGEIFLIMSWKITADKLAKCTLEFQFTTKSFHLYSKENFKVFELMSSRLQKRVVSKKHIKLLYHSKIS